MRLYLLSLAAGTLLAGCAVAPVAPPTPVALPAPQPALSLIKIPESHAPAFTDDADTATLRTAALHSLAYFRSRPASDIYTLATDTYTASDLADSLAYFVDLMDQAPSRDAWAAAVRQNFQVYQSVGTDPQRTVTFSSYYEPTIPGRLKRTQTYRYPIYGRPTDLIDVDLGQFDPVYQGTRLSGRRNGRKLVPYYSRREIDSHRILGHRAPIIAWARNPTDIFFLQIEGSGWLNIGTGEKRRIRYDGDNGRRYRSVGQHLLSTGKIPGNKLGHDDFERYLNTHPKERQSILNVNDRYVFFRIDTSTAGNFAFGNLDVPLTAGRSIATDPKLFPKGLLAWIVTDQPVFDVGGEVLRSAPLTRYMLNQDEGGAIQGPGRVDFFAGDGREATRFATHFWQKGQLYFLVKKKP